MILLNLISTEKKQELKLTQIYLVIKNLVISLLFLSTVLAIVLLLTKLALQSHFEKVVNETSLTTKYANTFGSEVREFNRLVVSVDNIQKEYNNWAIFFISLSVLTPANVTIDSLTIVNDQILIKGVALTRDDLINFKKILEDNELFNNIEVPIDNLLKKDNIKFDLKSEINLNNF